MIEGGLAALRKAKAETMQGCEWLRSPTPAHLEASLAAFERAAQALEASNRGVDWLPAPSEAREEVAQLGAGLRRARQMLDHAAQYHREWRHILGALVSGYTPKGEAAPVTLSARVAFEG